MRSYFSVGLFFCVLLACCNAETFNFEVSRRTHDSVRAFLAAVDYPTQQISQAFALGILNASSPTYYSNSRRLASSLINSSPEVGAVYIGLPDSLVAIVQSDHMLITTEPLFGSNCTSPLTAGQLCLRYALVSSNGEPTTLLGVQALDIQSSGLVHQFASQWSPVMPLSLSDIGVEYALPINNTSGQSIGLASAGVMISTLDSFLFDAFGAEPDERVVYIVERTTGKLVAASVKGITTTVQNGRLVQVGATNCSNALIKNSSGFLSTLSDLQKELLYVHENHYVQSTPFTAVGIDWLIVVVRPADIQADYITTSSSTYVVLCVICGLCAVVTVCLMVWVIRFRHLRLWKAGQPEALLLLLFANLMCIIAALSLMGAATDTNCLLRQWLLSFSMILLGVSLIAKLLRVYLATNMRNIFKKDVFRRLTARHVVAIVGLFMLVECIYLTIWSFFDPLRSQLRYRTEVGVVVGYQVCSCDNAAWFAFNSICGLLLVAGGCYLSFVTRNVSELFSESRALMTIFYHGTFIFLVLVFVGFFGNVDAKSFTLFFVVVLLWFTLTTQIALFFPRIYRQVTLGDFSMWEMKEVVVKRLKKDQNAMMMEERGSAHLHNTSTLNPRNSAHMQSTGSINARAMFPTNTVASSQQVSKGYLRSTDSRTSFAPHTPAEDTTGGRSRDSPPKEEVLQFVI